MAAPTGFRASASLETRTEVATGIRQQYVDRIPVIVECAFDRTGTQIPEWKKTLAPLDISLGKFISEMRKAMKIPSAYDLSVLTLAGLVAPTANSLIGDIDAKCRDTDEFLYLTLTRNP